MKHLRAQVHVHGISIRYLKGIPLYNLPAARTFSELQGLRRFGIIQMD